MKTRIICLSSIILSTLVLADETPRFSYSTMDGTFQSECAATPLGDPTSNDWKLNCGENTAHPKQFFVHVWSKKTHPLIQEAFMQVHDRNPGETSPYHGQGTSIVFEKPSEIRKIILHQEVENGYAVLRARLVLKP